MKIIDLLSKITTGELKEKVVFEYSCNDIREYWTLDKFFEEFPVDKDTLNYEVGIIKEIKLAEDKKIELIPNRYNKQAITNYKQANFNSNDMKEICKTIGFLMENLNIVRDKINEIIDKLNEKDK